MSGKSFFLKFRRTHELVIGCGFKHRFVFAIVIFPFQFEIGCGYP